MQFDRAECQLIQYALDTLLDEGVIRAVACHELFDDPTQGRRGKTGGRDQHMSDGKEVASPSLRTHPKL